MRCIGTGTQNRRDIVGDLGPSGVEPSWQVRRTKGTTDLPYRERESVVVPDDRPLCTGTMDAEGVELETEEILTYFHRSYVLVPR